MNKTSSLPEPPEAKSLRMRTELEFLNRVIYKIMLSGLALSTFLIVFGIVLQIIAGRPMPVAMLPLPEIAANLLALRPDAFFTLGLLSLVATPILTVIASLLIYAYERDWRFALVSLAVLGVVLASFFLGSK